MTINRLTLNREAMTSKPAISLRSGDTIHRVAFGEKTVASTMLRFITDSDGVGHMGVQLTYTDGCRSLFNADRPISDSDS